MTYGITKSEEVVKKWLINEKGYNQEEIRHDPNTTPDFICPDKEFEAKKLYGNRLLFYDTQLGDIQEDTVIVVSDLEKILESFKWKNKEESDFDIKTVKSNNGVDNARIPVPKEFAKMIREEYEGRNDMERLKNWKREVQDQKREKNNSITVDDIEDAVSRAISNELPEVLRREMM